MNLFLKNLILGCLLLAATMTSLRPARSQAGAPQQAPHVEAQVETLQWKRFIDGDDKYQNVGDILYLVKNTKLTFRATKDVETRAWSPGKPIWSGTAGASGTGTPTKDVTFSVASTLSNDYKTVIVKTNTTDVKTVKVVVCTVNPYTIPVDSFTGRSTTSFGITEPASCIAGIAPDPALAAQIGDMQWILGSSATTTIGATFNGSASLFCGIENESINLTLKILSGPSKDQTFPLSRKIFLPNAGFVVKKSGTNKFHEINKYSVGFKGEFSIGSKDVSFKGLRFREGTIPLPSDPNTRDASIPDNVEVVSVAEGWWKDLGANGFVHMQGNESFVLGIATGNKIYGADEASTGILIAGDKSPYNNTITIPPYADGSFTWPITWFIKPSGQQWIKFTIMNHTALSDSNGTATITKDHQESATLPEVSSSY